MMIRRLSFLLVASLAAASLGCGAQTPPLPPASSTPQPDQAQVKAQMEKSYEMMKKQGRNMRAKPPGG